MLPDLLITKDRIIQVLSETQAKLLEWLLEQKETVLRQVAKEGKNLIDNNVDELDENLRKQWPRKGKLEVEVYQERKG